MVSGEFPEVWIPPAELRDQRELLRGRISLVRDRTRLKNRLWGIVDRHNLERRGGSLSSVEGRQGLVEALDQLPPETRRNVEVLSELIAVYEEQIDSADLVPFQRPRVGLVLGGLGLPVSPPEALDSTRGVDQLLLAGKEGMAGGADLHMDVAFVGRAGLESAPAGAIDVHELVGGMDLGFHRVAPSGSLTLSLA